MKKICGPDRAIRIVAGIAIVGAGWYYQSWWGLIGLVLLATAAIGFCPLHKLCPLMPCCGTTQDKGEQKNAGCCDHDKANAA
jgi:hypothetical protein